MAHCRFYRRDLLGPRQERRLKDTRCTLPARSLGLPHPLLSAFFFFSETVVLQTSNSLTSPFSKRVHLYWWQCCGVAQHCDSHTVSDYRDLMGSKAKRRRKVWSWLQRIRGQCETTLWLLHSSLSPFGLCSLFLSSVCLSLPPLSCLSAISIFTLNPAALTAQESYKCSEWIM